MPGGRSLAPKIVLDTAPQLGGDLDLSGHKIADGGVLQLYNDAANHRIVLGAAGGDTSVVIAPNGAGALMASTGGDARGIYAIDLQMDRNADSTAVASGERSVLIGSQSYAWGAMSCALGYGAQTFDDNSIAIGGNAVGARSVAIGYFAATGANDSFALGYLSYTYGIGSVAIGTNVNAWGDYSTAFPGSKTEMFAIYSFAIIKGYSYCAYQLSQANGNSPSQYGVMAQTHVLLESEQTSGTAPVQLTLDSNQGLLPILPDNTSWAFRILLVARSTDSASMNAAWNIFGCIKRDANAASTALVGNVQYGTPINSPGWSCQVSADTANGALKIEVTGSAGKTVNWSARVEMAEIYHVN